MTEYKITKEQCEKNIQIARLLGELLSRLLDAAWEAIPPEMASRVPCSQVLNGQWYAPKFGCDTLAHMFDEITQG